MLARTNRLVRAEDYRRVVRRGRRSTAQYMVVYFTERDGRDPARFGFIVAKSVGVAVVRNRVRRRLKALVYEMLDSIPTGTDMVIRALPGSGEVSWATLQREIFGIVTRAEAGT
ncbi:MAG: ribonuclease P protein component [Lacisediminihabitans sp.]